MILSKKRITKALIRLRGCAGWSAPVLFANPLRQVFSRRGPFNRLQDLAMEGKLGVDLLHGSPDVQNLAFAWIKFHVQGVSFFVGDQGHSGESCYHFYYQW